MKKLKKFLVGTLALALALGVSGCGQETKEKKPAETETKAEEKIEGNLNVFAAASLKISLETVIKEFNKKYPDVQVKLNTDGSDKLYHQMKEGAPADLFISASQKWMKKSVEDGIVDEADQRPFLNNEVVMIRNINAVDMKLADIKDGKDLSLGAESVPVGGYTKKYFEQTKQWDAIEKDASFEPKVTDVVQKVAEGARNYGLVYQTDANSEIKKGTIAVCDKIPEESGIQVIYPIGITKKAENRKAAEAFEAFLSEGTAKDVLEDVGFVYVK